MRTVFYLCISIFSFLLILGCSGGSQKDLSKSPFYWPPKEVDQSKLMNNTFFSEIHKNNLGKFVFANETIDREWEDGGDFITVYDMSKMDDKGLFSRWFGVQNSRPDKIFQSFAKNPKLKKKAHLRYDYYLDSIHAKIRYKDKPSEEEMTWESSRNPVFEAGVIPGAAEEEVEMGLTQQKMIEILWENQKYIREKENKTLLLGFKVSVADGTSPGSKEKKNAVEMASGQLLLTNVDQGIEWISKIPKYSVPEPFVTDRALEKEGLKLMQNYARSQGWKEKYVKAVVTSINDRRNKYTGIKVGESVIFALVGRWPDGTYTSQFFRTFRNDKNSRVRYDGTGKQRNVFYLED